MCSINVLIAGAKLAMIDTCACAVAPCSSLCHVMRAFLSPPCSCCAFLCVCLCVCVCVWCIQNLMACCYILGSQTFLLGSVAFIRAALYDEQEVATHTTTATTKQQSTQAQEQSTHPERGHTRACATQRSRRLLHPFLCVVVSFCVLWFVVCVVGMYMDWR